MSSSRTPPNPRRLNVLALDGGGVRGLSSLLILRDLMQKINASIRNGRPSGQAHHDVEPHDIFGLVAGTSTGGLIAIMLGRLGMTLDECIAAYHNLSWTIFGKKHIRGRITHGLAPSKYSGSRLWDCVSRLVESRGFDKELPMVPDDGAHKIACAVVCREHQNESRYSEFKSKAVCICSSEPCPEPIACLVCEAARATSAAPTFFPVQGIHGRYFVDGGMECNNPSFVIYDHYSQSNRVAECRRTSVATESAIPVVTSSHNNLDFSQVRIINLGTGTKPDAPQVNREGFFAYLVPAFIRMGAFLKKTLAEFATNSENIANNMRTMARVSNSGSLKIKYERFSADNGVCYIKMDKFKELPKIETLTSRYLATTKVQVSLLRVAEEIAAEYLEKQRVEMGPGMLGGLLLPDHNTFQAQTRPSSSPRTIHAETSNLSGSSHARLTSEGSTSNSSAVEPADSAVAVASGTPVIPPRQSTDIVLPAEPIVGSNRQSLVMPA